MGHRQRHTIAQVFQPHASGHVRDRAQLAPEGYGARVRSAATFAGRKPDLIARGRPQNPFHAGPARREFLFLAVRANHSNRTFVVASRVFVIRKGYRLGGRA